jgi:glycosyltransferase involved in cell wall biosynthesis
MRIVIDTKNLALYGGGIAHWFAPLLAAWVEHRPDVRFQLLGPDFEQDFLPRSGNWEHVHLAWPQWLPRPFRHPWYDNMLFPRAVARLRPDLVMSPYHDVRMPKGIPSVIGVHDLCLDELAGVYPARIRGYYLTMLRTNLRRASHVITVSQTSRHKLVERYGVPLERISVVYNAASHHFAASANAHAIVDFKSRHALQGRFLLYTGGSEYRKNVERLVQAFSALAASHTDLTLLTTGNPDPRWLAALESAPDATKDRVRFAGKLSDSDLRLAYTAADAVVYPSLCEGFGRVCLESMEAGTPLACSDLPVMREVAGDYACWFDPYDVKAIADAIEKALAQSRRACVRDARFQSVAVRAAFLESIDGVLASLSALDEPGRKKAEHE